MEETHTSAKVLEKKEAVETIKLPNTILQQLHKLKVLANDFFVKTDMTEKEKTMNKEYSCGYVYSKGKKEQYQIRLGSEMKWPEVMDNSKQKAQEFKQLSVSVFSLLFVHLMERLKLWMGVETEFLSSIFDDYMIVHGVKDHHHHDDSNAPSSSEKIENLSKQSHLQDTKVSNSVLLLTHYEASNKEGDKDCDEDCDEVLDHFEQNAKLPCPSHLDAGVLTLCVLVEPGLEIMISKEDEDANISSSTTKSSSWISLNDLESNPEKAVVLIGESMPVLLSYMEESSCQEFLKTPTSHRVVGTSNERLSIVFKLRGDPRIFGPRADFDYKILKEKIDNQQIPNSLLKNEHEQHRSLITPNQSSYPLTSELILKPTAISSSLIRDLAPDIWMSILLFLTPIDTVKSLSLTCKQFRNVANHNDLWRFYTLSQFGTIGINVKSWKEIYMKRYRERGGKLLCKLSKKTNDIEFIKLMVVGDASVGKTCLLIRYTSNAFPFDYVPTVFDEYTLSINVNGKNRSISLWDSAGQSEYDVLRPLSYPNTDIFFITFSLVSRESFQNVETKWIKEAKSHVANASIFLVGTKSDLRKISESSHIQFDEGIKMAKKIGAVGYWEVSALTGDGIDKLMRNGIDAVLHEIEAMVEDENNTPGKKSKCLIM